MTDTDGLLARAERWLEDERLDADDGIELVRDLMAEVEQLQAALVGILTCCRECRDQEPPITTPADFILWGKLLPSEALGPKCYDHAVKHIGSSMPSRAAQYAVVDLRPIRRAAGLNPTDIT